MSDEGKQDGTPGLLCALQHLYECACYVIDTGNLSMLREMHRMGVNLRAREDALLLHAIESHQKDIVRFFLTTFSYTSKLWEQILFSAMDTGDTRMVLQILEERGDIDIHHIVLRTVRYGEIGTLMKMIPFFGLDGDLGFQAIQIAARYGQLAMLRLLHGVRGQCDVSYDTIQHMIAEGQTETLLYLASQGISLVPCDMIAVQDALHQKNYAILLILYEHGLSASEIVRIVSPGCWTCDSMPLPLRQMYRRTVVGKAVRIFPKTTPSICHICSDEGQTTQQCLYCSYQVCSICACKVAPSCPQCGRLTRYE